MTVLFKQPFTTQTYEGFVSGMASVINRYECLSILNLAKRDQLYRIQQIKTNQSFFKKHCTDYNSISLLYLDLTAEMIEDSVDFEEYVRKNIIKSKKRVVLFVLDADRLLDEKPYFISQFDRIPHIVPGTSIIYLFQKNITASSLASRVNKSSTFLQNKYIFPLYNTNDCIQFLSQLEQRFSVHIPTDVSSLILSQCGGHFWLIKQAVREYATTKNIKTIFTNEGMQYRLHTLYSEFLNQEIECIQHILRNRSAIFEDENAILSYFIATRLIQKHKKKYTLSIPLLEKYIRNKMGNSLNLSLDNKNVIQLNNTPLLGYFSRSEQKLLTLFIKQKNTILKRELCACAIWGVNYQEVYTDWALDQIIRRLRNKLHKIGISKEVIVTRKNQGYEFNQKTHE